MVVDFQLLIKKSAWQEGCNSLLISKKSIRIRTLANECRNMIQIQFKDDVSRCPNAYRGVYKNVLQQKDGISFGPKFSLPFHFVATVFNIYQPKHLILVDQQF